MVFRVYVRPPGLRYRAKNTRAVTKIIFDPVPLTLNELSPGCAGLMPAPASQAAGDVPDPSIDKKRMHYFFMVLNKIALCMYACKRVPINS